MYTPILNKKGATGYTPILGKTPIDYTGTLSELPFSPRFTMQTSTQAIPDETTGRGVIPATYGFAKDVGRMIAQSVASAGVTIASKIDPRVEPLKPEDFQSYFGQALVETVFGKEPNKSIEQRIVEAEPKIKAWQAEVSKIAQTPGLNPREKFVTTVLANLDAPTLAFTGIMGSVGIDLSPFGGLEKNVFKEIVKVKNIGEGLNLGRKLGIADDLLQGFAENTVRVANDIDAEKLFKSTVKLQTTTKEYKPILGRVAPESARTAPITPKTGDTTFSVFDSNKNIIGKVDAKDFYYAEDKAKELFKNDYSFLKKDVSSPDSLAQEARKYKSAEEFVKGYKQFAPAEKQAVDILNKYGDSKIDVYGSFSTGVRRGSGKVFPDLDLIIEDPKIAKDILAYNTEQIVKRQAYAKQHNLSVEKYGGNLFKTPFEAVGRLDLPEKYKDLSNKFSDVKIKINDHWFSINSDGTARALGDSLIKEQLVNRKPLKQALEDFQKNYTKSQLTDIYNKTKVAEPRAPRELPPELENLRQEIEITEDVLADMPGKGLAKYVSRETGELPEISSKAGKGKFNLEGDTLFQDLVGQELSKGGDVTVAHEMVDAYKKAKVQLEKLKVAYKEAKIVTKDERILKELGDRVEKANERLASFAERFQAQIRLRGTIEQRSLQKWENVREAMKLPPISKMSVEQFDKLNDVLSQYKTGDEFLPVRQLETIDRTELTGLRTVREVQEHLAGKYNLTPDKLPGIKPHPWMYDAQLARQHPLYDLLVDKYNVSYLKAGARVIELEKENSALISVARASRPRGVGGTIAPTDKNIVDWLEASPEVRGTLAEKMTGAELKAAQRMDEVFHEYYDWLSKRSLEGKFESRFEDKYFPHVRRGFLEAWKEDGFLRSVKEQFDQFKQEERMLTILDSKTGEVLPYEKWIGFSQFRTGGLVPTQNAARSFKTYITALEKARQFDEFIPEIMTYVHSLSPKGLTARGIELDDSLKRFVKTWINSKKGRVQQQIVKQGSRMDWALRMGVSLTRIRDLGLNIPVGIANIFGEQAGNLTMLGTKNYSLGVARLATSKGRSITKQYENFVGRTFWEKLTEASNTAGDQLLGGIYGLFGAASRRGNQVFLLGNMTSDEFAKGVISIERLAQLRKGMGKYRVVEGAESIFGKSAEAAVGGQYKKWAIPILVSTKDNVIKLAQIVKTQGVKKALSSEEGAQLFYSIGIGSALGLGVMGYYGELKDKKDRNFVEDLIFKSTRDAMSMIGVLDPKFLGSFAAPRLASFFVDLGEAISNLILLERYKSGELKGVQQLETLLTPSVGKQLMQEFSPEPPKTKPVSADILKKYGIDVPTKADILKKYNITVPSSSILDKYK